MNRTAIFSPDRVYRYTLWREWPCELSLFDPMRKPMDQFVMFIGLNPSTADEVKDDPTVRRCIGFTRRWGYRAMCMTNCFGYRATDPRVMMARNDPEGPDNRRLVCEVAVQAAVVVCAWGSTVNNPGLGTCLSGLKIALWCLGRTSDGHPRHPLYVRADKDLERFDV